jgi:hypothetical protein
VNLSYLDVSTRSKFSEPLSAPNSNRRRDSERLLLKIAKRSPDLALILPARLGHIGGKSIIATVARTTMRNIGMKADLMKPALMRSALMRSALGLLSAVVSASFAIGPAAAADMPGNPPPPSGYYGPPVEEGYAVPPPPAVYAYPPAPVYPYRYALPPVAYVPAPYYYARPYYGFYGPWRSRGYAPYWAGRYHGYYR